MLPHSPPAAASRPLLIPRSGLQLRSVPVWRLSRTSGAPPASRQWRRGRGHTGIGGGTRAAGTGPPRRNGVAHSPGCEQVGAGPALTDRDRRFRTGVRSADPWTPSSAPGRARTEHPGTDLPFPAEAASPPPDLSPSTADAVG